MDRRDFLKRAGAAAGATAVAGCLGGGGGGAGVPDGDAVNMVTEGGSSYYFNPVGLHVEPGTTVTFINHSGTHSSTAYDDRIPEGAEAWNSGTMAGDDEFEHTFEVEGTYDYFCIPHESFGMVGRIVVGSSGGPAEGSDPSAGALPSGERIVEDGTVANGDFDP